MGSCLGSGPSRSYLEIVWSSLSLSEALLELSGSLWQLSEALWEFWDFFHAELAKLGKAGLNFAKLAKL